MKPFEEVYECDSITINVTNNCNLSCSYCFESSKSEAMMSFETAKEIIDKSYRDIPKEIGVFTINLFGGEPFLNWKLIKQIIDYTNLKKYNVRYGVTTNMTILTEEIIDYIDDNDIMLLVSIDGIKEIHDKNRCNSYDIVIKNFKTLIDRGLDHLIEARMTITPNNVKYLTEGVESIVDLGINNICPMFATDLKWSEDDLELATKSYIDLMSYYISVLNKESERNISIRLVDDVIINSLEPVITDSAICPIGNHKWCSFDTNGDIYPCHQCPTTTNKELKDMLIGNIYTGVDENKVEKYDMMPILEFDRDECVDCDGKIICKHGCPSQNIREMGNSKIPTPAHCDLSKMMVYSTREFRDSILNATNIRSRKLNVLKENLKVKEYFDTEFKTTNINTIAFNVKLLHFKDLIMNLDKNLLPSFKDYFEIQLATVAAYLITERGETYGE